MITISIVSTVVWLAIVPFFSSTVSYIHYNRVSVIVFILCLGLIFSPAQGFDVIEQYHSLFSYSNFSVVIESTLYLIAALVLVCFSPMSEKSTSQRVKPEYSLILIFSILGASMIISANDIISMYVALELQSFGLYILACLRTDQAGSTHASLKYFLLGAISSAFILLGISIIYQEVGSTGFQNISSFLQVATTPFPNQMITLGLLSMLCGFMFKISAAPFHSWFSDVIQGVPTYTGMVIMNLPKISIFTFLFNVLHFVVTSTSLASEVEMFIVITTLFSLVLGTVAGLMQTKLKRLLAFSTISHVGFILIGLVVGSESSLNAIVFYLIQYTLTVVLTFLALVAYENSWMSKGRGVDYIVDLQGTGQYYKLLTFTFVLCLFSMAGIPPLTGFYAKLGVLNSSIMQNISIVFITAIVCSVISAAYYLKVIKVLMFDTLASKTNQSGLEANGQRSGILLISPLHSYTMSTLTAFLCLFILDPKPMINCTELVALSLYLTLLMTLFVVLIFVPILVLILLMLNLLLAPSEVDSEKISTYEAGFEPVGTARSQFSISFYLVAILFLIFDLEIALFYPLATSLNLVSTYGFVVALMFLSVLTFGFVFEYGSGVISFKTERDIKQIT